MKKYYAINMYPAGDGENYKIWVDETEANDFGEAKVDLGRSDCSQIILNREELLSLFNEIRKFVH